MLLIERHLLRQFAESVAAVAVVLLLITLGALFADLISEIAKGKVPAGLLLSQLGLRSIRFLTLVLPLALFLGLLLAIGRLYAESEMAVLASVGIGPQRLWRPLVWVSLPIMLVVGLASLWLAPLSAHRAKEMIEVANRSFLIAGLEPGRFVELPGKGGVLYVTELTPDGTRFKQLFVQRENEGRMDIITAHEGSLKLIGETERYLHLKDGFRVEGAIGSRDFRMMRFESNDVRVPDRERNEAPTTCRRIPSASCSSSARLLALAELHWRMAMPLFVGILALFAHAAGAQRAAPAAIRPDPVRPAGLPGRHDPAPARNRADRQWLAAAMGRPVVGARADAAAGGVAVRPRRPPARAAEGARVIGVPAAHGRLPGDERIARHPRGLGGPVVLRLDPGFRHRSCATSARKATRSATPCCTCC